MGTQAVVEGGEAADVRDNICVQWRGDEVFAGRDKGSRVDGRVAPRAAVYEDDPVF